MENEFKEKYKVDIEKMGEYPEIINLIQKRLRNKSIDIYEFLEKYKTGMSIEHIKVLYRINEEEMEYIRSKYVTEMIETTRESNIEKMKKVNVLALPKEDLEGYKSPKNRVEAYLNLQDAIKIVEGVER